MEKDLFKELLEKLKEESRRKNERINKELMVHNVMAIKWKRSDGEVFIHGEADFNPQDTISEQIALVRCAYKGLYYIEMGHSIVEIQYIKCLETYEAEKHEPYKTISIDEEWCKETIANFNIKEVIAHFEIPNKTLEILPDACYNKKLRTKLRKMVKNHQIRNYNKQNHLIEWGNNHWWYLHGKLEDKVHFDKAIIINCLEAGDSVPTVRWHSIRGHKCEEYEDVEYNQSYINGIRKCNVLGVCADCLGFFWTREEREVFYDKGSFNTWEQRGLVVKADDKAAIAYALGLYMFKSDII